MPDESAETPKRDANENPWYQLATLYGEPGPGDHELQARNRMAWNRYMAGRLTDEARATLIDEKRHSAEELTPFSPDELEALAQDFAKRSGSPDRVPCPVVEGKIDFSSFQFGHFSASGFFLAASVYFSKASFSGGADFGYVTF